MHAAALKPLLHKLLDHFQDSFAMKSEYALTSKTCYIHHITNSPPTTCHMTTKKSQQSSLKILTLVSGDLWAGAEAMVCNLLRRLKGYENLDLSVILLNQGRLADELRSLSINVQVVDEQKNSFWKIFLKIREIIGSSPPNIIHSHRYKENLLALLISGCCRDIKLVSSQHGLPECYLEKLELNLRIKILSNFLVLSRFFTTVAVSYDIRSALINRFGFRQKKVEVIHNGIELPPCLSESGIRSGSFVIGSSGRLFPVKDYQLMVRIAQAIAATGNEDVRFELAGDGPELSALEALVRNYGLDSVFMFRGHMDNMYSFYQGLDVYLNTSLHEGIPMTILEALAHGLPVIAPAVGGIVEIIEDGEEGFLMDCRTPELFADKCLFLRDNLVERKEMAQAAREKAAKALSAAVMADEYHQLYCRLAAPAQISGDR